MKSLDTTQQAMAQARIDASWKGRCIERLRHIDPTMFELEAEMLAENLWQSPIRRAHAPEDAAAGAFRRA